MSCGEEEEPDAELSSETNDTLLSSDHLTGMASQKVDLVLDQLPFTISCLPYGIISTKSNSHRRCAAAIGNHVVDLLEYARSGALSQVKTDGSLEDVFDQVSALNMVAGFYLGSDSLTADSQRLCILTLVHSKGDPSKAFKGHQRSRSSGLVSRPARRRHHAPSNAHERLQRFLHLSRALPERPYSHIHPSGPADR